jgi:hypothetical protein
MDGIVISINFKGTDMALLLEKFQAMTGIIVSPRVAKLVGKYRFVASTPLIR